MQLIVNAAHRVTTPPETTPLRFLHTSFTPPPRSALGLGPRPTHPFCPTPPVGCTLTHHTHTHTHTSHHTHTHTTHTHPSLVSHVMRALPPPSLARHTLTQITHTHITSHTHHTRTLASHVRRSQDCTARRKYPPSPYRAALSGLSSSVVSANLVPARAAELLLLSDSQSYGVYIVGAR